MAAPTPSRLAAASAVRHLVNVFCGHDAPDELLDRIAKTAGALSDEMSAGPRWDRQEVLMSSLAVLGDLEERRTKAFVHRAVAGPANPAAIPVDFVVDGESVSAIVELGPMQEGAPGRAHGGVVAGILDELSGVVPAAIGSLGATATLTVNYLAPIPVEVPLTFRTWLHKRDGRKLEVHGEVSRGDEVFVTSESLFVAIDYTAINTGNGKHG